LPIIESIREIYPQTAVVPEDTRDLIENIEEMTDEVVRVVLMP